MIVSRAASVACERSLGWSPPLTYRTSPFVSAREAPRARWRRGLKALLRVLVVLVLLAAIVPVVTALYLVSQIPRVAVEPSWSGVGVLAAESSEEVGEATHVLLTGIRPGEDRPEHVALLHLSEGRDAPVLLTLPPDLAVEVPGAGPGTISSAWQEGPDVLLETVASYTALDVHRYVEVDLGRVPDLARSVGSEPCFGPTLVADSAAALTVEAPRHPVRAWRTLNRARGTFAVDEEAGRLEVLGALWDLREPVPNIDLLTIPTRDGDDGERRARLEPTEAIFQALRSGEDLPSQEETVADVTRPEEVSVIVLNGSGVQGTAAVAAEALEEVGFGIIDVDNASSFEHTATEVHHPEEQAEGAAVVAAHFAGSELLPAGEIPDIPDNTIVVILGRDWAEQPTLAEVTLPEADDGPEAPEACW
jgi:hypothetical protein